MLDLFSASLKKDQIQDHREMRKICWNWDGPEIGGRCEVNNCIVHNETFGEARYHYMAPCEIIARDGDDWLCRIDYTPDCRCAAIYNGQILRLGVMDIWPPVRELNNTRIKDTHHSPSLEQVLAEISSLEAKLNKAA